MQLDSTRIPVLERSYDNLLDLTLVVVRQHALPLLLTSLLGAVPFAAINYFLMADVLPAYESFDYVTSATWYVVAMAALVAWQAPLASIPTTLYLGEAIFVEKPDPKRMLRSFWTALPQVILVQVLFRGLMAAMCGLPWLLMYWFWPYLNEIVLLERNPLTGGRDVITTSRRASTLHGHFVGNLFGRWIVALAVGGLWTAALAVAIFWLRMTVANGDVDASPPLFEIWLPVALWIVVSYFNVVRFLSYLDLRIRGEGWEIELRMRAEANRLKSEMA